MENTGDIVPDPKNGAVEAEPAKVDVRSLPPDMLPEIPDDLPELPPVRKIGAPPISPVGVRPTSTIRRSPPRRMPLPDPSAGRFRRGALVVLFITVLIGVGVISAVDRISERNVESEIVVPPREVPLTELPPPPARKSPPVAPPQGSANPNTQLGSPSSLPRVRVRIVTEPQGAELILADSGSQFGHSPESIEIPRGMVLKMTVQARGYQPQTIEINGSTDVVRVELVPKKGVTPRPPPIRGLLPKPKIIAPVQKPVAAAPNPPAEVGIIFDSVPRGANVFVDDVLFCEGTPCLAKVKSGMRKVRLELNGFASKSDLLRVDKATTLKWKLTAKK